MKFRFAEGGFLPKFLDIKPRRTETVPKKTKEDGSFFDRKKDEKARPMFINIGTSLSRTKKVKKGRPRHKINRKKIIKYILISSFSIALAGIIFIRVGAVKAEISQLSSQSEGHIDKAYQLIDEGEVAAAMTEADMAGKNISKIKLLAQAWGQDFTYLKSSPYANSKLTTSERLLDASYLIVSTMSNINAEFTKLAPDEADSNVLDKGSKFVFNIEEKQKVLLTGMEISKKNLTNSRNELEKVAKKQRVDVSKNKIESAIASLNKTIYSLDSTKTLVQSDLPWLSGMDGKPKNIMIIFQNNAELRGASGGSLGSFGIARFVDGKLIGIDFGKNIYKIDHAFEGTGQFIEPPEVIRFLRGDKTDCLKDSGWPVDGPESFRNILKFYKLETGEDLDGAIMMDTTAVALLLSVTGSIEMPEYNQTIGTDNFRAVLEDEVHKDYFIRSGGKEENEPKKIISDMMPKFLSKIFDCMADKKTSSKIFSSLSKSLKQKDLVFYFEKSDFEERIENLGYAAKIPPAIGDFLYLNNSNIAGEKSSLNVAETLNLKVNIGSDGKIENQLELKRKHTGSGVWPDGINKNFVRMLVSENSLIKNFDPVRGNFEQFYDQGLRDGRYFWLDKIAGKSEVNFWMTTEPGQESAAIIDYSPAYSVKTNDDFTYLISLQKQPGANSDQVTLELKYPDQFTPVNVKNYDEKNHQIILNINLDHDQTVKIKFRKN